MFDVFIINFPAAKFKSFQANGKMIINSLVQGNTLQLWQNTRLQYRQVRAKYTELTE